MNVLNEDKDLIENHFFDANLGKLSKEIVFQSFSLCH